MVIKVYVSGISASKEVSPVLPPPKERETDSHAFPSCVPSSQVKKRQQRALFILDSLKVAYEAIDITEPANQEENERFRSVCKRSPGDKLPLPPQFFNDDTYCGVSPPV